MNNKEKKHYLYLSYFMDSNTPLYGGEKGINIKPLNQIKKGDSANTKLISFHNHSGTHIDYPNHFINGGKTSSDYNASFWIFDKPYMLEYDTETNQIINLKPDELKDVNPDTDFLILKTGFGKYRGKKKYWKYNPGLSPDTSSILKKFFPKLRVVGIDFISITSFQNRSLGRIAHRQFLGGDNPLLLVEDMDLSKIQKSPRKIFCAPIMIDKLDGSPVNIIAEI